MPPPLCRKRRSAAEFGGPGRQVRDGARIIRKPCHFRCRQVARRRITGHAHGARRICRAIAAHLVREVIHLHAERRAAGEHLGRKHLKKHVAAPAFGRIGAAMASQPLRQRLDHHTQAKALVAMVQTANRQQGAARHRMFQHCRIARRPALGIDQPGLVEHLARCVLFARHRCRGDRRADIHQNRVVPPRIAHGDGVGRIERLCAAIGGDARAGRVRIGDQRDISPVCRLLHQRRKATDVVAAADGDTRHAKLVRARVLAEVATHDAAIALVREVLAGASERELPLLRLEALLTSADLELKAGDTGEVAARLEEALGWARGQGLLLQELRIHELYVRYLIATGQHAKALEMQRRVLELIDALNLVPRRERALLRLAEIHALLDEVSAARSLLADVKDPALRGEAAAIAARLTPGEGKGAGRAAGGSLAIDLQPLVIRSVPRDDAAEAVFILTNPNPEDRRVEVTFESRTFVLAELEDAEGEVVVDCDASAGPGDRLLPIKAVVPGAGQLPISLVASGLAVAGGEASVRLKVNVADSPAVLKSEWEIDNDGKVDVVAVLDAARLRNNAFCLVPVFHHIAGSEGRFPSVVLRMVASEPTRIEGFAPDGKLLFVDAQGNGSFQDPGDLIATASDLDLCPVVKVGEAGYRIALRYAPESRCANGRVEIRIETKEVEDGADWKTDAVDWLEP